MLHLYFWFVGLFVPVPGLCKKFAFPFFFEVAMTREKFPEKIPFRLTRMLTNAMEVWTTIIIFDVSVADSGWKGDDSKVEFT